MPESVFEVRWHARGGQGAVTASRFLAAAALRENKYFQGFPEFGTEREGAPIQAFNRISASRLYYSAKILGVPDQFFFDELPGVEQQSGMGEPREEDAVLASLMNVDGVTLAKAFRDADSMTKRKMISSIARVIADAKE